MRLIVPLADRLLGLVAPRVSAQAACCEYQSYTVGCGCTDGYLYEKICWTNCCESGCGSCFKTATKCA
jgi:hypothetical protein